MIVIKNRRIKRINLVIVNRILYNDLFCEIIIGFWILRLQYLVIGSFYLEFFLKFCK